ncbi:trans-aconitate 2-methyltransferase [Nostoc sp. TCL26-01]|uniref:class I SAM-dependent methyltransferase n=1 Tax=Nostoc sp. TCL26-01 TaxID=2576904 RepID=UPI0015BA5F95|nr:class I SAM-dependent methyltransferase [Nostoc sp. TCL26-01]QLE56167.1 methyltransferase domain-containing protein [Nostoc sp. TCL26-01]
MNWYKEDLAFIHDVGFADYAVKSAPAILGIFQKINLPTGFVVDLGCGSGLLTQELVKAGYQAMGIDISESMIAIARRRLPQVEFKVGSFFKIDIPPCHAVTCVSECLNYLFDPDNNQQTLYQLFCRIYTALLPGGVFIFDIAEPGQVNRTTKNFTQTDDWTVLVEKTEDQEQRILTRYITSFRKIGEHYRRSDEIHHQKLYKATDIAEELRQAGFQVQISDRYGQYYLPKAHAALIASK